MASPEIGDDYEEQIQRLVQRYETELRKRLKRGVRPLHEIEREADEIGAFLAEFGDSLPKEIREEHASLAKRLGHVGVAV